MDQQTLAFGCVDRRWREREKKTDIKKYRKKREKKGERERERRADKEISVEAVMGRRKIE